MEDHGSEHSLNRDTIHDLLSEKRRRFALSCLVDHDSLALPDLADEVAEREHEGALPEIPEEAVLRTYLALYHNHIPKLSRAGVVTYDQKSDRVALAENADSLKQHLSLDSAAQDNSTL